MYCDTIPAEDVKKDAEHLGLSRQEFMDTYLAGDMEEEGYPTKHCPCDFLKSDGSCKLGDCNPQNCVNYPYTNQPDRLWSLYSVLEAVEV